MAEVVLSNTLRTIRDLTIQEVTFLRSVHDKVDLLKAELRAMQNFLKEANETQRVEDRNVRDTVCEIRELAYLSENIIEKINWMNRRRNQSTGFMCTISRYARLPGDWITLHNLGVKIDAIISRISQIPKRKDVYVNVMPNQSGVGGKERDTEDENSLSLRAVCLDMDDNLDIVGFDYKIDEIVEELLDSDNTHLTVVSIVGMGGIGKSTLARKVCMDPRVLCLEKKHFDTFVWVTVSKTYEINDLLKDIMRKCSGQIDGLDNEVENTRQKIHEYLKEKKYLIVLDDVWSADLWKKINFQCKTLCDMNNGSRIILTTRKNEVAKQAQSIATITHELEPLDEERSWELLRKKAFPSYQNVSGNTKNELERLGEILAKKCHGLPLALVVLGGHLSKHLDPLEWSNIAKKLLWEDADDQMLKILALSYHDIQDQFLKSCFLYTASFPEDSVIHVSDLVHLWIAEGFVEPKQKHTLEEAARRQVDELAQRCMVRVVERSKTGLIKKIRIHDVLRDWSIKQASTEGFLKVYTHHDDPVTSSSNAMLAYRVAFHKFDNNLHASMPELRTIIISFDDYERQVLIQRFKYLRVLSISGAKNLKALSKALEKMFYLRYLGLRNCGLVELPSSMDHLLNLQTLDSRGTEIKMVPRSLWRIESLRHVHFGEVELFEPLNTTQQNNFLTLSMNLSDKNKNIVTDTSKMLPKSLELMAQLTGFNFSRNEIPLEIMISFARSEHLRALKLVGKLIGHEQKLPNYNLFAPNLEKLTLIGTKLLEDPMPTLEKLPNLVVLRLGLNSFLGSRMTCSQIGFRRLQYLILNLPNVAEWEIAVGAMPGLTRLVFCDCSKLTVFPHGIHNLKSLVVLEFRLPNLLCTTTTDYMPPNLLCTTTTDYMPPYMPKYPYLLHNLPCTTDDIDKLEKNGCKVIKWFGPPMFSEDNPNACCVM